MKKFIALAVAGTVALGSLAITTASEAGPWQNNCGGQYCQNGPHANWNNNNWNKGNWNNNNWNNNNWNNNNWNWKKHHHHDNNFVGPLVFGLALGAMTAPYWDNYPGPYAYNNSPHVQWCLAHYRTYNPATNLFYIRVGVPAVCVSPYSY